MHSLLQFQVQCTHLMVSWSMLDSVMEQLEYSRQSLLGYNAGLHLLPTYLLQYLGMCNLQQLLFESGEILFLVSNILYVTAALWLHLISSGGGNVYPMDVAANPLNPNQFAVGMSDGAVHVLEPWED